MTGTIAIAGSGLAELTCAWLLASRGHRVRLRPRPSHGSRPLLLGEPTLALLRSLWRTQRLTELSVTGHHVTHRQARWGSAAAAPPLPQPAMVVDGAQLADRLLAHLTDHHPDAVHDAPAGDSPPEWTVTAAAPGHADAYWTAGRRHLLAGEAPLAPGQDDTTSRLACTDLAWLHLTPLGKGKALLQAMVPGPAENPVPLLNQVLAASDLAPRFARPVSHAVSLPAAPRLHPAPATAPTATAPGLLLIGAGAIRYDPLSGTGAAQALRTAILAAAVIHAAASGIPSAPLCAHFTTRLRAAFHEHLATCAELYLAAFPDPAWQLEIDAFGRGLTP